MQTLFTTRRIVTICACLLIGAIIFLVLRVVFSETPDWVTTTVEIGTVEEVVSVSGFIESKNTAELAFPTIGRVTEVFVSEGQEVSAGEVLATQASSELVAKRNDATAALTATQAKYSKLLAGESLEVRATANTALQNAKQTLARTIREQVEKVKSAKAALLSTGLTAYAVDINEEAPAPEVAGTYLCDAEGTYTIEVYNSNAFSGYSYRYSGIESGTTQAGVDQPSSLGACGLTLQFAEDQNYGNSKWTIAVPNTNSPSYIQNKNTYALAVEAEQSAVEAARDAVTLATSQNSEVNAGARSEEVNEALAQIDQVKAQIAAVDAQIADRSITAPFDGIVTTVDIIPGETSPTTPTITVLARDAFELKARIPEIDITTIGKDQKISVIFDAQPQSVHEGTVAYVSPLATPVDGVAYFEATMVLDSTPSWIKSGLNADVDIVIQQRENVPRIPKRFIFDKNKVLVLENEEAKPATVEVVTEGNNGYVQIGGLKPGTTVIAP